MKILFNILLFCFLFIQEHYGQHCGTENIPLSPKDKIAYARYRSTMRNVRSAPIQILLKLHIIRKSDGTGGVSLGNVARGIKKLNQLYGAHTGVTFKICQVIDYIDNTTIYDNPIDSMTEHTILGIRKVPYAVDLFYAELTNPTTDPLPISWTNLPGGNVDWIIMKNSMADDGTLAHEMGHYLGLRHTHDQTELFHDPAVSHDPLGIELVARTDCATRGDGYCDTPADPNILTAVSSDGNGNCTYTGTHLDFNGVAYVPDIFNIMSYTNDDCRNSFSAEQINDILFNLFINRSTIYANRNSDCPCSDLNKTMVVDPMDFDGCNQYIDWGAEIDAVQLVEANNEARIYNRVTNTGDATYQAGQTIRFLNGFKVELGGQMRTQIQSCTPVSNTNCSSATSPMTNNAISAATNSSIDLVMGNENQLVESTSLQCYPNPTNKQLNIMFTIEKVSNATLRLMDVNGRTVVELTEEKLEGGIQQYQLNTEQLIAGVYILVVQTNGTIQTKKVVIQH